MVGHVWLINPVEQVLEVYRLESSRYVLLDTFESGETIRVEPFDAIEIPLGLFWEK